MNTLNLAIITVNAVRAGENLIRVDADIKNAPADLFGAAFHLHADGVKWKLNGYEAGDVFSGPGLEPLMIAEEKHAGGSAEIVFGISLKRTDEAKVSDGKLVSFYLQTEGGGDLEFSFSDTRLSVLNESRRDIENAVWESKTVRPGDLRLEQKAIQASVMQQPQRDITYMDEVTQVYFVMMLFLVVSLLCGGAYFLYKRGKNNVD